MSDAVLLQAKGAAFWITINRPDKRNALNAEVIEGIRAGYAQAHAHSAIRVIVLTGAGDKAFCAGGDLQPDKGFVFDLAQPNVPYADMLREAHSASLPSIARVNGVCMAGGMGLLCMTDLAVSTDDALFGLPEVKVGVFPMQVMSLLQRQVPKRLVQEVVDGRNAGQVKPLHPPVHQVLEISLHHLGRQPVPKERQPLGPPRHHADVGHVALVAAARPGQLNQAHPLLRLGRLGPHRQLHLR